MLPLGFEKLLALFAEALDDDAGHRDGEICRGDFDT